MHLEELRGYRLTLEQPAEAASFNKDRPLGLETLFVTALDGPRIVVADSVSYGAQALKSQDVLVAASYAGRSSLVFALRRGVAAVVAHEAGVGLEQAGISGLALCDKYGVPAAAVATMGAGLSHGPSVLAATITYVNAAGRKLGVEAGMAAYEAATRFMRAPPGQKADPENVVDHRLHEVYRSDNGVVIATDSTFVIKDERPDAVVCGGPHCGRVFAESILKIRPRGAIANDAGMGKDALGIAALALLDEAGIAAASVASASARIGSGWSTYHDGVISAANTAASKRGVRIGMSAKESAALMLKGIS